MEFIARFGTVYCLAGSFSGVRRPIRVAGRCLPAMSIAPALLGIGLAMGIGLHGRAEAQSVVFSIPGTGQNKTTSGGITTDDNWKLVAMPEYVCTGTTPTNCATAPAGPDACLHITQCSSSLDQ